MEKIHIDVAVILLMAAIFGMWWHFHVALRAGRLSGNFVSYMFAEQLGRSTVTIMLAIGAVGVVLMSGAADDFSLMIVIGQLSQNILPLKFVMLVSGLIGTGYTLDSTINRGQQ